MKEKHPFQFNDFMKQVDVSLTSMLKNTAIGNDTMTALWHNHRNQKWFLDGLHYLHWGTVYQLSQKNLLTILPFVNIKKILTRADVFVGFSGCEYNAYYRCLLQYQQMVRQPGTMSILFARALLLRYDETYSAEKTISCEKIKKKAASILETRAIDEIYKYYMFTEDQYAEGHLDLSKLLRYRVIHPSLFNHIDHIEFSKILNCGFCGECVVLSEKQITNLRSSSSPMVLHQKQRVRTFYKHQPIGKIVNIIMLGDVSHTTCDINIMDTPYFMHSSSGTIRELMYRIPYMTGRKVRKIRRFIDDSKFIVSLPVDCTLDEYERQRWIKSLSRKCNILTSSAKFTDQLIGKHYSNITRYLQTMWTYEELVHYQLIPSMMHEKVQQWLQSNNQTRRRLLCDDGI